MSKSYFFQYPQLKVSSGVFSGFSSNSKKLLSFCYIPITISRKSVDFGKIYVYGIRKIYQWLDAKCIQCCLIFTLLYYVPPLNLAKNQGIIGGFLNRGNSRFTYMDIAKISVLFYFQTRTIRESQTLLIKRYCKISPFFPDKLWRPTLRKRSKSFVILRKGNCDISSHPNVEHLMSLEN